MVGWALVCAAGVAAPIAGPASPIVTSAAPAVATAANRARTMCLCMTKTSLRRAGCEVSAPGAAMPQLPGFSRVDQAQLTLRSPALLFTLSEEVFAKQRYLA